MWSGWVLSNHDETRHVTRYGRAQAGVTTPPTSPWAPAEHGRRPC
ncbi:hypothetical protein [Streptomyces gramineus]